MGGPLVVEGALNKRLQQFYGPGVEEESEEGGGELKVEKHWVRTVEKLVSKVSFSSPSHTEVLAEVPEDLCRKPGRGRLGMKEPAWNACVRGV